MATSELSDNDVAITGMAFRLPGIKTYESLTETLFSNLPLRPKCTETIPKGFNGEFPAPGFHSENMHTLDAIFFGMSNILLTTADRTQMKVLEMTFEALTDAGFNPTCMKELVSSVYQNTVRADGEFNDVMHVLSRYHVLGNSRALAPNRISFHFDLKGSSVSLDAGYTGGIKALELGWRDIKNGLSDLVVVTSANLFIDENITRETGDLGWLSNDGNTCVFDNEASGYRRTEAVVSMILQPASRAKRIYALVRHVSCLASINEHSFQSPTRESWTSFLKEVYKQGKISPEKIQYLEAYGSAHKEWDAYELNAVMEVLGTNRETPLLVGSVKSNIGHTEGASDLVSIIKAIICFETGKIPPNRGYSMPNRGVPSLINGQLKVADQVTDLVPNALIAVNGYSYGNVYGHCVLEGFKKPKTILTDTVPRLIPLSARIEDMFPQIFQEVEAVSFDLDYFNLLYGVFTERITKHLARGYMIFSKGEKPITAYQPIDETDRPLWLVFSGMGSQWPGMGKDLMKLPIARASIQKCHDVLLPRDLDLINIITTEDQEIFKDNLNSFVGIAAIQIALVDLLNTMKIVPDGIIGHSVGEVGCAYADGCLDLEQTILAAYYRGKAVKDATLIRGAMAAIGKGYEQIKTVMPESIEIACHNSKTSSTMSGPGQDVMDQVAELSRNGVFAKIVEVGNIAFHSRYIAPAGPFLLSYMNEIIGSPKLRSSKWKSSSVHEADWSQESALYASPEYFTNNLLRAVLFEETCAHVPENAILIEVAPHGLLQAIMKRSFPKAVNIPLASRTAANNLTFFLQAVGKLYMTGVSPEIASLYPPAIFPVATKTNSLHGLFPWTTIPKSTEITCTSTNTINLRQLIKKSNNSHEAHIFHGIRCTAISYYALLVWNTFYQSEPYILSSGFSITDLRILNPFELNIESDLEVEGVILPSSRSIELTKKDTIIASAFAETLEGNKLKYTPPSLRNLKTLSSFSNYEIYDLLTKKGYSFSREMQFLKYVEWTEAGIHGKMAYTADWVKRLEALMHMVFLNITHIERRLVTVSKIGLLQVAAPEIKTEPSGDLELFYDPVTNELSCSGLYIQNVTFNEPPGMHKLSFASILPYINPPIQSLTDYIDFCSQIVTDYKEIHLTGAKWNVLEFQDEELQPLYPLIQLLSPNIQTHHIPFGENLSNISNVDLVVCKSNQLHYLETYISDYVIVRGYPSSREEIEVPSNMTMVSVFSHDEEGKMTLFKKKVTLDKKMYFTAIPTEETDLVTNLRKHANIKTSVLLVGFSEPVDGIPNFIRRIQSQTSLDLKWLFILDDSAPEFGTDNSFYEQQLGKGLHLNILQNGLWKFAYEKELKDITENVLPQPIEGEVLSCDSELSWIVPSEWQPEDSSVEVAQAYAMAYFCLSVRALTKPFEGVLITDGLSLMGQAAIHVAFTRTTDVYVTVDSEDEVNQLKVLIPRLDSNKIIVHSDPNFSMLLAEKVGKKSPTIFYNLLDGKIGENILTYAPKFSKIFHFGKDAINGNKQIGMYPFVRMISFIAMSTANISRWHIADKRTVWHLVEDGIRSGVVRPLKVVESSTSVPSVRNSQKVQHLVAKCHRDHEFVVSADGAYLLIGESSMVDLDIAEWLVKKGASNIILYNPSQTTLSDYQRKLNLLMLRKKSSLQLFSESSIKNVLKYIKQHVIQIEAIFFIHLADDEHSQVVDSIEEALNAEFRYFVAVSRNRQYTLKMHKLLHPNKMCMDVLWNAEDYLIAASMDGLTKLIGEHSYLTVGTKLKSLPNKYHLDFVGELIPTSLNSFQLLGAGIPFEPSLIELATLGRKMNMSTLEIQPVFFFPGVGDDAIEGVTALAKEIAGPAFLAKIPCEDSSTMSDMASAIIPAILKVATRKVYNLVGLSTGCVLSMEVARQLEQKGAAVSLMLVNNPVQYLQQLTNRFDTSSLVMDAIASISPNPEQTRKHLQDSLPTNQQLAHFVSSLNLPLGMESLVLKSANHITNQMNAVANYSLTDLKLNGPLTVVRSQEFLDQLPYREICVNYYIKDIIMEHADLIASIELAKIINKFIVLDDMGPKTIHDVVWVPFENALARHRIQISKNIKVNW